jgi:nucleoside-diphosphate-sugar epimerase
VDVTLRGRSDYLALATGNAQRVRLETSHDPRAALARLSRTPAGERRNVLLLGANGFVGMHILHELLTHAAVQRVDVVVRRKGDTTAEKRLAQALQRYQVSLPDTDKLRILEGAFNEPAMGLDEGTYRRLCRSTDMVVHAAGTTNHIYSYARYRREAILPLLELMAFCLRDRAKSLHVVGSLGGEVFRRPRDFYRLGFYHCGYARMKWVLKEIMRQAWDRGIPAHLYQAPYVLGSRLTAYRDQGMRYAFWIALWYVRELKLVFDGDAPIIPGDLLARSIVENAFDTSPQPLVCPAMTLKGADLARVFGWRCVPWKEFRAALKKRFGFAPRQVHPDQPLASLTHQLRDAALARFLFPRHLPQSMSGVAAALPAAHVHAPGLSPIDLVARCAANIRPLRGLAAEAGLVLQPSGE